MEVLKGNFKVIPGFEHYKINRDGIVKWKYDVVILPTIKNDMYCFDLIKNGKVYPVYREYLLALCFDN